MSSTDVEEQFRRMVFNVVARNRDDHVKHIAFLMNKQGQWRPTPAFDVTYSNHPTGDWTSMHQSTHQSTHNAKRDGCTRHDFRPCAKPAVLNQRRSDIIVGEGQAADRGWAEFAEIADVEHRFRDSIFATLRLSFPRR